MLTSLFLRVEEVSHHGGTLRNPAKRGEVFTCATRTLDNLVPFLSVTLLYSPHRPTARNERGELRKLFDTTWGEGTSTTSLEELFAIRVYKLPVLPIERDLITKK